MSYINANKDTGRQYVDKNWNDVDTSRLVADRLSASVVKRESYLDPPPSKTKYAALNTRGANDKCVGSYELEFSQAGTAQSIAEYKCVKDVSEMGGRPVVDAGGLYNVNVREQYRYPHKRYY